MAPKAAPAAAAPKAKAKGEPKKKVVKEENEEDKVEKVPEPDRAAFDARVAKVQEEIDKLQKKQVTFNEKIKERSVGKEDFFAKKSEIRAQMDEYAEKIRALQEQKDSVYKQVGAAKEETREMRQKLQKMKKSVGYNTEQEIDDRIKEIENTLVHNSHTLHAEKKFMEEIRELKKSKPKIAQFGKMEGDLQNTDNAATAKESLGSINEELNRWRDAKKALSEKMNALSEERKTQLGDLPDIIEQRDAVGTEIRNKIWERNQIRDEFRAEQNTYNAYLAELRKARQAKADEERQARKKEMDQRRLERAAEKLDDQPHVAEITLIEQSILYCKSLITPKEKAAAVEKKEVDHGKLDGMVVLSKKEDRDEWFAPKKAKKGQGGGGKAEKGAAVKSKSIKHNAETFRLFDQLKLDAPLTTDDIPALLEKLEVQLKDYQEKVKVWEEKREEMKRKILEEGILPEDEEAEKKEGEEAKEPKEEAKEEAKEDA